jgi:hypothetical protein
MTIGASARPEYFLTILSMDYLLYYCNNVYLQILGLATIRWAIWKVRIGATFERKKVFIRVQELMCSVCVYVNYLAGHHKEKLIASAEAL